MTRYQLGKIVGLAGTLPNRKRVQKVVHLLQAAGCPIEASYRLHHYGPYSDDVASLLNQLVQAGLLVEQELPARESGRQFRYRLSPSATRSLAEYEGSEPGAAAAAEFKPHLELLQKLLMTDLMPLEYASTIVFNRQAGRDWDSAIAETCDFKHVGSDAPAMVEAEQLARSIIP